MARAKSQYARGRNPNSLANLKQGNVEWASDPEKARAAQRKGEEVKRTKQTMREIANKLAQEEQEFTLKDGSKVTMSKLEVIVANFFKMAAQQPTHKNVLALRQILGEDVQQIEATINETKYNDIQITAEMEQRALVVLQAKHDISKC